MCECGHKKVWHHRTFKRCLQTVKALNGMNWCPCRMYRATDQQQPGEGEAVSDRKERSRWLMALPGVVGVGHGTGNEIRVYVVAEEFVAGIPKTLNGHPVTVIVSGVISAGSATDQQQPGDAAQQEEE